MDARFSKIDRIHMDCLRRSPRVDISDETKIKVDQKTACRRFTPDELREQVRLLRLREALIVKQESERNTTPTNSRQTSFASKFVSCTQDRLR